MEQNIYITALKIGADHMETGISYNSLEKKLNEKGIVIESEFLKYFKLWFYSNFFTPDTFFQLKSGNPDQALMIHNAILRSDYDNVNAVICSDAYETLIDYQKIEAARTSAKKANSLALLAVIISGFMALVQIILQVVSMCMDNNHFCLFCGFGK